LTQIDPDVDQAAELSRKTDKIASNGVAQLRLDRFSFRAMTCA